MQALHIQWPRWWWELAAAILSLTSMLLVVIVLCRIENKPLDHWPPPIQLNSLITVLTTVGKTAMLTVVTDPIGQLIWLRVE